MKRKIEWQNRNVLIFGWKIYSDISAEQLNAIHPSRHVPTSKMKYINVQTMREKNERKLKPKNHSSAEIDLNFCSKVK